MAKMIKTLETGTAIEILQMIQKVFCDKLRNDEEEDLHKIITQIRTSPITQNIYLYQSELNVILQFTDSCIKILNNELAVCKNVKNAIRTGECLDIHTSHTGDTELDYVIDQLILQSLIFQIKK